MILKIKKPNGFTLIELVIVVAILAVLSSALITDFVLWTKKTDVNTASQEFANVLRLAKNKALSSENNSQYGVYLNTLNSPSQYILFKGATYATRDSASDNIYSLPKNVEFFGISFGGGSEIDFNKLSGTSQQSGSVAVRSKLDTNQSKTIYISSSGVVSFSLVSSPSDSARVKDSRHVHVNYSRNINTATESISLNFDNGASVQTFPISSYLVSGQIEWLGTVLVGGSNQTVEIHTHRLNNPDTQFSIHRDRRLNSKSLKITISGDSSGSLVEYSADGLTTNSTSIYASNLTWQ